MSKLSSFQKLERGCGVRIHGLKKHPQMNGLVGLVHFFDGLADRWHVNLNGVGIKALRIENMTIITNNPSSSLGACAKMADEKLQASLIPGDEIQNLVLSCLEAVNRIAHRLHAKCVLFGSWAQQTALPSSDLDVALLFKSRVDWNNQDHHSHKIKLLESFLVRAANDAQIRLSSRVFHASVPILRLEYANDPSLGSTLELDLSVGNSETGMLDDYIRESLAGMSNYLPLVRLVKLWARRRHISKSYFGCMISSCWTILAMFFVRTIGSSNDNEHGRTTFLLFLDWLQGLNAKSCMGKTLSFRQGGWITCAKPCGHTLFWVEDPTLTTNNLADSVRPEGWKQTMEEVERALELLRHGCPLSVICDSSHASVASKQQREQNDSQEARKRQKIV